MESNLSLQDGDERLEGVVQIMKGLLQKQLSR